MSHTRRSLKGLCASLMAASGLMAFSTASAHAVTWDINGAEIAANATASGNLVAGSTVLVLVPAQNLIIHCTGITVEEGVLRTDNTAHIRLQATGCTTKVKGVESPGCKPEILPLTAKAKPILHNGRVLLLAEALTAGANLTVIHYSEETCALPPLPSVKGSVAFECYTGALVAADCKTSRIKQLIRTVPGALASELKDALLYGLNPKELHIEAELFLTGANLNQPWNALI